jgi:hypothetical protein
MYIYFEDGIPENHTFSLIFTILFHLWYSVSICPNILKLSKRWYLSKLVLFVSVKQNVDIFLETFCALNRGIRISSF